MLKVALTGGIATGKSHVLRRFARRGIPTIDADAVARDVVRGGTPGHARIRERFGEGVIRDDGEIDRQRLASIVFADGAARRDLEAIVHPLVYEAIDAWVGRLDPATPYAVADIPLLFETGSDRAFDRIVVTSCPPEIQIRRVMARDGVTEAEAGQRLAAQWPIEEKARRAAFVIDTSGTMEETDARADGVADALAREAAAR
jgi:dephospho-CoA kinase